MAAGAAGAGAQVQGARLAVVAVGRAGAAVGFGGVAALRQLAGLGLAGVGGADVAVIAVGLAGAAAAGDRHIVDVGALKGIERAVFGLKAEHNLHGFAGKALERHADALPAAVGAAADRVAVPKLGGGGAFYYGQRQQVIAGALLGVQPQPQHHGWRQPFRRRYFGGGQGSGGAYLLVGVVGALGRVAKVQRCIAAHRALLRVVPGHAGLVDLCDDDAFAGLV